MPLEIKVLDYGDIELEVELPGARAATAGARAAC